MAITGLELEQCMTDAAAYRAENAVAELYRTRRVVQLVPRNAQRRADDAPDQLDAQQPHLERVARPVCAATKHDGAEKLSGAVDHHLTAGQELHLHLRGPRGARLRDAVPRRKVNFRMAPRKH